MAKRTEYPIHPDFKRWSNMNPTLNRAIVPVIQELMSPLVMMERFTYRGIMKQYTGTMKRLGGSSEYYAACDTLQFEDYSPFAAGTFNDEHKRKVREKQFTKDLRAAYDIGYRLIQTAAK